MHADQYPIDYVAATIKLSKLINVLKQTQH